MTLRRRIEKSACLARTLGLIMASYFRLCRWTSRWTIEGLDQMKSDLQTGPVYFLLWHSRSALAPCFWPRGTPIAILHDGSPAGRMGGNIVARFGFRTIQASKRDDGGSPGRELLRAVAEGHSVGMVGDGPRGPARRINDATLGWARRLDGPVWGFAFASKRHRRAKSWDQQMLPLPFSRGAVVFRRLDLSADWTDDEARLALAAHLDGVTARADTLSGLQPGP